MPARHFAHRGPARPGADPEPQGAALAPSRPRARRRSWAASVAAIVGLLGASAFALDRLADAGSGAAAPAATGAPPASPATPAPSPTPTPSPTSPEPSEPSAVLSLPGDFPEDGPGTFRTDDTEGERLGESGQLLRFQLAVEENIDPDLVDPVALAGFVDETLGDDRGWTAGGDLRFQRVPGGEPYDFRIVLTTTGTTERLCGQAGLRVVAPGLPDGGVSCRLPGQVVLNLHRWLRSVPHYVDAEVPLTVYRQMVLNHEVGHQLGYGHEACPEPGEPAPVMQQQTIALDGCEAWPWPYLDGERYTGPVVP